MRFFCNFALFFSIFDKMEVKTRAIVLQTIKYGDAQLIVDFSQKSWVDCLLWSVYPSLLREG